MMELTLEAFGFDMPVFRLIRGYAGMPPKRAWYKLALNPLTGDEESRFCCLEGEGHKHDGKVNAR